MPARARSTDGLRCAGCGAQWPAPDGIPRLRLEGDARTETVRRFYDAAPFPGYPPGDSLTWLRARAGRSAFARLLDASIAGDARIAEVGCGTGQMSLYLARADREVVALDLSREALKLGADAARRYGIGEVAFVEADLTRLPLKARRVRPRLFARASSTTRPIRAPPSPASRRR